MNPLQELQAAQTRRAFLEKTTLGLGSIALADLLRADETNPDRETPSADSSTFPIISQR